MNEDLNRIRHLAGLAEDAADETQMWDAAEQPWEQHGIHVRYFSRNKHVGVQAVDMKTGEVLAHDSHPSMLHSQIRNLLRTRTPVTNEANEDEQDIADTAMEREQEVEAKLRRILRSMGLSAGPHAIYFDTPNDVSITLDEVSANGIPLATLQHFTEIVQGVRISASDSRVVVHLTLK